MCELQGYLKSLNPKKGQQGILIYGSEYKLWREGEYIGTAIWEKDNNIGDSFQNVVYDKESGLELTEVCVADRWELVIKDAYETSLVECLVCENKWVAVRPLGVKILECPKCNNMTELEINL